MGFFYFPGDMTIPIYQGFLLNEKSFACVTSWKAENFKEKMKQYLLFTVWVVCFFFFPSLIIVNGEKQKVWFIQVYVNK